MHSVACRRYDRCYWIILFIILAQFPGRSDPTDPKFIYIGPVLEIFKGPGPSRTRPNRPHSDPGRIKGFMNKPDSVKNAIRGWLNDYISWCIYPYTRVCTKIQGSHFSHYFILIRYEICQSCYTCICFFPSWHLFQPFKSFNVWEKYRFDSWIIIEIIGISGKNILLFM